MTSKIIEDKNILWRIVNILFPNCSINLETKECLMQPGLYEKVEL
jgi:hypothetical protein